MSVVNKVLSTCINILAKWVKTVPVYSSTGNTQKHRFKGNRGLPSSHMIMLDAMLKSLSQPSPKTWMEIVNFLY